MRAADMAAPSAGGAKASRVQTMARSIRASRQDFLAVALPPLRPASFFWAVVPPWLDAERFVPELLLLPPRLDAPGEFEILAARSLDMPLSFRASYCFS